MSSSASNYYRFGPFKLKHVCLVVCIVHPSGDDCGKQATVRLTIDDEKEEYHLDNLIGQIREGSVQERTVAFSTLQELFEKKKEGLVEALIAYGSLSALLDCLDEDSDSPTQFAALMVFANLTSGTKEQSQAVVSSGAVMPFIRLVDSPRVTLAEQAIICVGNIACDDAFNRKVLYENGGLHAVVRFLNRENLDPEQLNSGVWAFSNMCRSRTLISLDMLESCVATIRNLVDADDPEILRSACAASAYLTDGPSDRIQMFLDGDVCKPIISLIKHADPLVVFSALRAVSNFLSGSDEQLEEMIDLDVAAHLGHILKRHKERRMIKEACMALSNIAAGSQHDISKIVEEDLVKDLIHAARHAPMDVRIEATWAIGNAIVGSGHALIREFLSLDCIKVLSAALTMKNPDIVKLALEAIRNFLWCGDFGENPNFDLASWDSENDEDFWEHADWLSNTGGFYRLTKLRENPDQEIAKLAFTLLDALIEDPNAEYSEGEFDQTSDTDNEDGEYEDLLNTINSLSH